MANLKCPLCGDRLLETTVDRAVFHLCGRECGWMLGIPLLRRLVPRERVLALWRRVKAETSKGPLLCGSCDGRMTRCKTDPPNVMELDACPRCQMVWFDQGELPKFSPDAEGRDAALEADLRDLIAAFVPDDEADG